MLLKRWRIASGATEGIAAGASHVFNVSRLIDELLNTCGEIRRRWSRGESSSMCQIGYTEGNLGGNLPDTAQRRINPTYSKIGFGDFPSQRSRSNQKCLVGNKPAAAG